MGSFDDILTKVKGDIDGTMAKGADIIDEEKAAEELVSEDSDDLNLDGIDDDEKKVKKKVEVDPKKEPDKEEVVDPDFYDGDLNKKIKVKTVDGEKVFTIKDLIASPMMQADYTKKTTDASRQRAEGQRLQNFYLGLEQNPEALTKYYKDRGLEIAVRDPAKEIRPLITIDEERMTEQDVALFKNANKEFAAEKADRIRLEKMVNQQQDVFQEQAVQNSFNQLESKFVKVKEDEGLTNEALSVLTAVMNAGKKQWGDAYNLDAAIKATRNSFVQFSGDKSEFDRIVNNEKLYKEVQDHVIKEYLSKKAKDKDDTFTVKSSSDSLEAPEGKKQKKKLTIPEVVAKAKRAMMG